MRLYYGLVLTLLLACSFSLKAQHITFETGNWKEMLARAKSENKLIFIDVYATWCGPCKMLDQQVFTDKKVADTYNTYFLNYKVDAERGEGIMLARQYNVRAYPTALFVDGDGQLIDDWVGFKPAPIFREEGERVFRKTPLGLTLSLHESAYREGNRNSVFMKTYLLLRQQAGLPTTDILNDYVRHLPVDSLKKPFITTIVLANTKTCTGPAFEMLMSRKDEPRIRQMAQIIVQNELTQAGVRRNQARFDALCRFVEQLEPADLVAERIAHYRLIYQADAENWKSYAEQADAYTNQFLLPKLTTQAKEQQPLQFKEHYDQLCNVGYHISQHSKDNVQLSTAFTNLMAIGELHPTPYITTLQACLRYRLGQRDEAVALQTKALDMARNLGDDVSGYEETLRRMQKKKAL